MPELFEVVYLDAVGVRVERGGKVFTRPPNSQAALALIERKYGKPRQSIDQTSTVTVQLDPGRLVAAQKERRLLEAQWAVPTPDQSTPPYPALPGPTSLIPADPCPDQDRPDQ
jgi:hypothetical protein